MKLRSVAKSLVSRLPKPVLYELFYQAGRALGVRSFEVAGQSGNYFGSLYDQSVIKTYLRNGTWSPNLIGLLSDYFATEGGTFYDIGANIGLVSLPLARLPDVRVISFEPDPINCALLRANAAMAQHPIEIVNAAISDQAGELRFARSDYNAGDHRLATDGAITVRAIALDDLPMPTGRFAVKIDTQGAEPMIFRGGARTLAQAGLIVSEFWPWGMRRMGQEPEPIIAFASQHFNYGLVLHHDERPGAPLPIAQVIDQLHSVIAAGEEHDAVDLVLIRR